MALGHSAASMTILMSDTFMVKRCSGPSGGDGLSISVPLAIASKLVRPVAISSSALPHASIFALRIACMLLLSLLLELDLLYFLCSKNFLIREVRATYLKQ